MTDADKLRAMARYIRKHGFSPELNVRGTDCGCFLYVDNRVGGVHDSDNWNLLRDIVGVSTFSDVLELRSLGWDESATKDAAAACEIAADLVTP